MTTQTEREIASQPAAWRETSDRLDEWTGRLPGAGLRLAVVGCGTSYYVAQAFAAARETMGLGESDAFPASEMPSGRRYDAVLAISRSGTTTEVVRLLRSIRGRVPTSLVTAVPASPLTEIATATVVLDFADESSVVQTRFATCALALLRAHLGIDLTAAISDSEAAIGMDLPVDQRLFDHFVFLGSGWTVGLAHEAALKMRETAGAWTEAFAAMEYRHGPISGAGPTTLAWGMGDMPSGVLEDVSRTGARVRRSTLDAMAELILVQRMGLARAVTNGRDPDRPPFLTRSIILD